MKYPVWVVEYSAKREKGKKKRKYRDIMSAVNKILTFVFRYYSDILICLLLFTWALWGVTKNWNNEIKHLEYSYSNN